MSTQELIPTHTNSYDSLTFIHPKCVSVYKKVGYTPLQAVRDISPSLLPEEASRCTYVGRLDPMAEGWMHVLWSGDMEEKEKLASLHKIYEIDVVCGISTDTGDALGMVVETSSKKLLLEEVSGIAQSFVGPFTYPYPKYSSPHMKETLKGTVGVERLQKGNIEKIEEVACVYVQGEELEKEIEDKLSLCRMDGDFRLESIQSGWKEFFIQKTSEKYVKVTLRVYCSSGTYMRTLAEELGKKVGVPAYAQGIKRIGIQN